jgi:hypothetical protein
MTAPLIISVNLVTMSSYSLETYSNAEAIALNQDPLGAPGFRMVGPELSYPCGSGSLPVGALAAINVRVVLSGYLDSHR